ncbi:MAG TPA: cytochrome P450, partial [Candidatus Angelobacter sp.]|nr:cytochrome P450 [Candidatus Angelobacter sp.]
MEAASKLGAVPGPQGYSLPRIVINMWWNPLRFLSEIAARYGDIVCVHPKRIYLVNHPDHVRQVLHDRREIYSKSKVGATPKREAPLHQSQDVMPQTYLERRRYLGFQSIVRSEGEVWRRQRSMVQPIFSRSQIAGLAEIVTQATRSMLTRWSTANGAILDIEKEMLELVRTMALKSFFGGRLDDEAIGKLAAAAGNVHDFFDTRSFVPLRMPERVPTATNRRFRESFQLLSEFVDREIMERRRDGHDVEDMLGLMLRAKDDESGEGLNQRQLYDEALMLAIVGHQTTAAALMWTLHLLEANSACEKRLHGELVRVLGERAATLEDLPKLTYLRQVVDESMRLYPPTWIIARRALQDDVIGGYQVPAGADVVICPYVLHRHPGFWEDAEIFDPDRFVLGKRNPAFVPFGYGERICMASHFALTQISLVLADI